MKNKTSDVNNDLDKTNGEGGERILVSNFLIKGDRTIFSVSACKSDKEIKVVSRGSRKT